MDTTYAGAYKDPYDFITRTYYVEDGYLKSDSIMVNTKPGTNIVCEVDDLRAELKTPESQV